MNFKNVTAGLCAAVMALTMLPAMSIEVQAAEAPAGKEYAAHVDSSKFPHATGSPIDAEMLCESTFDMVGMKPRLTNKLIFSKEAYPGQGGMPLNRDNTVFVIYAEGNGTVYSKEGGGVFAPEDSEYLFSWKVTNNRGGIRPTSYDFSGLDTSKVTKMKEMFYGTEVENLDLSSFDTSNVTNMSGMFSKSKATSIDVSNFDTSNVTAMYKIFLGTAATSLDVSNFNTSQLTDTLGMFQLSSATSITGLSNFDTSNVTDMRYMFWGAKATTLDLSGFDISKVTKMSSMFKESKATTVLCKSQEDIDRFKTESLISSGAYDGGPCSCDATGFKVALPEGLEYGQEGANNIPVTLKTIAHTFSVTVPTSLPISVAADGTISCADASACKVINNEEGPVDIKSVTLSGDNQWVIVPISTAMESEAVNTKKLAMTVMGYNTNDGGLDTTAFQAQTIKGNGDFGIVYTAKLPTQTVETDKAPVANVVFTIGWHEAA